MAYNNTMEDIILLSSNTDLGTRYSGGARDQSGSPFVKGYFQVFFKLPPVVVDTQDFGSAESLILTSLAKGFTPHGDRTLNKVDIVGQGNVGASFVTGQQVTREFTVVFSERKFSPVYRIFRKWTSVIIDPYTGLSTTNYLAPDEYKGQALIIETAPVLLTSETSEDIIKDNIQRVFWYDGVWPTTDFSSIFDSNVESNDIIQDISVNFSFDGQPLTDLDDKVLDYATKLIKNAKLYEDTINYYTDLYKL